LEAKISFAVKYNAKIGEKGMVVISPLSVDLGGSLAKSASQTITVTFHRQDTGKQDK
jgi:hypothetical protein